VCWDFEVDFDLDVMPTVRQMAGSTSSITFVEACALRIPNTG